ncbi:hypothetical protein QBC35DRAFT_535260 [Podospora australis]|uniref:Uncharacterized protein n=1 Tax=Podospora australis TaxID=1536484 RepID=A0AAN6WPN2_9PEZI|nr:hypothetical protein QBC35DRAFT_535260 [Podospora australis]
MKARTLILAGLALVSAAPGPLKKVLTKENLEATVTTASAQTTTTTTASDASILTVTIFSGIIPEIISGIIPSIVSDLPEVISTSNTSAVDQPRKTTLPGSLHASDSSSTSHQDASVDDGDHVPSLVADAPDTKAHNTPPVMVPQEISGLPALWNNDTDKAKVWIMWDYWSMWKCNFHLYDVPNTVPWFYPCQSDWQGIWKSDEWDWSCGTTDPPHPRVTKHKLDYKPSGISEDCEYEVTDQKDLKQDGWGKLTCKDATYECMVYHEGWSFNCFELNQRVFQPVATCFGLPMKKYTLQGRTTRTGDGCT